MRTKRREKRTKLLLSAFGNIYPPFIVTPLFRNVNKYTEDLQHRRRHRYRYRRRPLRVFFLNVTRLITQNKHVCTHSK